MITTPEDSHKLLHDSIQSTGGDAMSADTLALTAMLDRINSQLGRVIHPVAPSGEADLPAILRKRLFYRRGPTPLARTPPTPTPPSPPATDEPPAAWTTRASTTPTRSTRRC